MTRGSSPPPLHPKNPKASFGSGVKGRDTSLFPGPFGEAHHEGIESLGILVHDPDPWKLTTPLPLLDWSGARAAAARPDARRGGPRPRRRCSSHRVPAVGRASARAGACRHFGLLLSPKTTPPLVRSAGVQHRCGLLRSVSTIQDLVPNKNLQDLVVIFYQLV
ncbi:hypothetical protein DAI22_12g137150 [Oryza sativa Japonica Group]|nr:hypothetical protein DAI22_12g137150 [Oryza sativa Japonica Group]